MAKAKQTRARAAAAAREENHEIGTQHLESENEVTEDDAIAELRGMGASAEYKFTVARAASNGKAGGYCATYGVGELSLDAIREQFGGGKYTIRVTDAAGRYVTNRTVEIVDLPKVGAVLQAAAVAQPPTDMNGLAAVIAAMKPDASGQKDMTPLLIAMMESQTKQMIAMMNRPVPVGPTLTDLLALINANKPAPEESSVKLLLQGLELGRTMNGGESSMMDIAREGLGMIAPLLARQEQEQPRRPMRQLPAPNDEQAAGAVPAVTEAAPVRAANPKAGNAAMMQKLNWLKNQLAILLVQASRGKDPELYAEVMLDNLPPFLTEDEILQRMSDDNAVANLAMLEPRVKDHLEWFEAFREACISLLSEEEGEPGPQGGQPAALDLPAGDAGE